MQLLKGVTKSQLRPNSRMAGLGIAMGLAAMLVAALLLGAQQVSKADAGSAVPPASAQGVRLSTAPETTSVVATSPDYWPMEYISGTQIVGHDIDLMSAIAAQMAATVIYTNVAFNDLIAGLVAGEYDAIISSLSVTAGRDELIDYTFPYVTFAGNDSVAIAVQQGNDPLRHQFNEALWQLRTDGTLGTIVAQIAVDVPAWQPTLPDWPYVPPNSETVLVYTNPKQCSTVIQIPRGAVTETILLAYTAVNTATAPSGFAFAHRAFALDAYQDGLLAPGFTFSVPVTITMHYTETDLVGIDETALRLYYWNNDTSEWQDVATTCVPHSTYDRHPDENWLAVGICHLSKYVLFEQHRIYLPVVLRNL